MELAVSTRMAFAEEWCKEVAESYQALERKREEWMRVQCQMDGIKAVRYDRYGGPTTMEHGDDALFATIERLERAKDALIAEQNAIIDAVQEFNDALAAMDSPTYARLLELRYKDGKQWRDIAKRLGYSDSHVYGYMKIAALLDLYDAMPEHRKVPQAI